MQFDYMCRVVVDATLDVDDIGNCCIQAFNDSGEEFYLVVKTQLGWTEILEYGPIIRDVQELPKSVICNYQRFEYKQDKVAKVIEKFLNEYRRNITQAMVADVSEVKQYMRNLVDYI